MWLLEEVPTWRSFIKCTLYALCVGISEKVQGIEMENWGEQAGKHVLCEQIDRKIEQLEDGIWQQADTVRLCWIKGLFG